MKVSPSIRRKDDELPGSRVSLRWKSSSRVDNITVAVITEIKLSSYWLALGERDENEKMLRSEASGS
ncbi:hypothetical protein E2C01_086781 [Portunus trituberculatus]|uniref:Uncharacterized protein n=1 Tax=Portunus trituberculatus TaxID=210409 RepID=A0A5B7JCC6_PORTR|nr:hypothetical protein [Portunus trituberculatus]